jgi:hypothetical protein
VDLDLDGEPVEGGLAGGGFLHQVALKGFDL